MFAGKSEHGRSQCPGLVRVERSLELGKAIEDASGDLVQEDAFIAVEFGGESEIYIFSPVTRGGGRRSRLGEFGRRGKQAVVRHGSNGGSSDAG